MTNTTRMTQDLLRKTSKSDKGYDVLEQAVEKIKDAAEFINEGKREHENMDLLLRLEKQLSGRRDLVRANSAYIFRNATHTAHTPTTQV
jgi:hypothetical protein